jgi:hypothetical protein
MRRSVITVLLTLATGIASAQTYLSPDPAPTSIADRFRLEVGLFSGSYDTKIRLDNVTTSAGGVVTVVPGTEVSGEDDLGLASSQYLGQGELTLLPGKHHMIRLSGLSMKREGSNVLTRTIKWGNSTYNAGERVDSHLNFSMIGLTYGYLPFRSDRFELGVSFGIQIASISANAEVRSRSLRSDESAAGPIPLLGIEGRYDFTPRWSIDARIQHLSLTLIGSAGVDLSGVDGTITDGRIAIRWRQNQHVVYGLGYRQFNIDVNAPTTDPAGMISLALSGPLLFVQASL